MSKIFFGFLKNQVFPGTEVLDEEDTERERARFTGTFVTFSGTFVTFKGHFRNP